MKITVKTIISRSIDDVWTLVADDFTSIQRWSASVVISEKLARSDVCDAPSGGRYCTFTDDPQGFGARETITRYDRTAYRLEFEVVPMNAPAALPLKRNYVTISLERLSNGDTELTWVAEPELKVHGYLLYPVLRLGIAKSFGKILSELKAYAEGELAVAA